MSHSNNYVPLQERTSTQMGTFDDFINALGTPASLRYNYTDNLTCRMTDHDNDTLTLDLTNQVVNGTFTNTTGWTGVGATLAAVNTELEITNTGAAEGFGRNIAIATVVGRQYAVQFDATQAGTSNGLSVQIGITAGGAELASKTYVRAHTQGVLEVRFTATTTTAFITFGTNSIVTSETAYVDNVELYVIPSEEDTNKMAIFDSDEFGSPWKLWGGLNHIVHYTNIAADDVPTNVTVLFPNFNYDPETMTIRT